MKATDLIINVRVVDVVLHPKDLGGIRAVRCIGLELMLVDLLAVHQVNECSAIYAAFRMTISCHVSGVAPTYVVKNALSQIFPYPHDMSE